MAQIYEEIGAELEAGRASVLATIVMRKGSAPRGLGTKMLVRWDGSLVGTVGGGPIEARSIEAAKGMIESGTAQLLDFDLMDAEAEACGMICGGFVNVYLERLDPADELLVSLMNRLAALSEAGQPAAVALRADEDREWGTRFLVTEKGRESYPDSAWPDDLQPVVEAYEEGRQVRPRWIGEYFVEPVLAGPTVYIFGGGHVSGQIAPLAALVDFRVKVIDDRPEFVSPDRFPSAEETICRKFEGVVDSLKIGPNGYAVIVTRGHTWDGLVLADVLKTPAAYVGMIGSRHKRNAIYHNLLGGGYTQADIDRVHSPIGLDIGSETPEEIAVAIVAELIKARSEVVKKGLKSWKV